MDHFDESVVFGTTSSSNVYTNIATSYSEKELAALKEMIDIIKNDEERATLACWGDHSEYSKGY